MRSRSCQTPLWTLLRGAAIAVALAAITGPTAAAESADPARDCCAQSLEGVVEAEGGPLSGLTVSLHLAFAGQSWVVDRAPTDGDGRFDFGLPALPRGSSWDALLRDLSWYLTARGAGGSPAALMAVLGNGLALPEEVVVNELTTVAGVWTTAQFLDGDALSGNPIGLRNAAGNAGNLVDPATGQAGPRVFDGVNIQTTTLARLHSLGTLLGACAGRGDCAGLFDAASAPGEPRPADTLEAAHRIALHPWRNVQALFDLLPSNEETPFPPILRTVPTDWTLSLVYTGGGLDAPGGISIDAQGRIWTNNNFMVGSQSFLDPRVGSVPGLGVTKLAPDGTPLSPPFGFEGGGTNGAGFGLAIDQQARVWVGNFAGDSLSVFDSTGNPLSPEPDGYTAGGGTNQVQGTVVDQAGNVWAANLGGDSVSYLPAGRPQDGFTVSVADAPKCGFDRPFGIAIDHAGGAWVANLSERGGTGSIVHIDPSTYPELCPEGPVQTGGRPQGVALDAAGNVWVTQFQRDHVTLYRPATQQLENFTPADGALTGGWGIAVDGDDNVWIADFWGQRVVQLCGVAGRCPPGMQTGERISTAAGYGGGGGVQFITSVVVDQAGNVLVANNNNEQTLCDTGIPLGAEPSVAREKRSMRCGGNGVAVFYGIAAPVAAPLIGPPRQP